MTNLTNSEGGAQNAGMTRTVSLYQAKTQLRALVDAAASGEEIVIAENGVAKARLVPIPPAVLPREPSGLLNITYIAEDFDAPDPDIVFPALLTDAAAPEASATVGAARPTATSTPPAAAAGRRGR